MECFDFSLYFVTFSCGRVLSGWFEVHDHVEIVKR